MKNPIAEFLTQLKVDNTSELEYYMRRGQRLYFRTADNKDKFQLLVSISVLKSANIKYGQIFNIGTP